LYRTDRGSGSTAQRLTDYVKSWKLSNKQKHQGAIISLEKEKKKATKSEKHNSLGNSATNLKTLCKV
jgi:hypothetical protein